MARKPKISPEMEEQLREELEQFLDVQDDVIDKARVISRAFSEDKKRIASTIALIRRRLKGVDLPQLDIPGTEKPEPHRDPVVLDILKLAGGIVIPTKGKRGGKRNAKAPAPEPPRASPLEWKTEKPGRDTAAGIEGTYAIEAGTDGAYTAKWDPTVGQSKLLVIGKPLAEAKQACVDHHLERHADWILKNAGAGDLVKRDLAGPPERFRKKGGRRRG